MERILVVDDTHFNRDLLEQILTEEGYRVELASSAAEALEAVGRGDVDLVLLDIMMPGVSGTDALVELRRDYTATELPVIMVTAKDQSDDVVDSFARGANDYVVKPIDIPVLLARMRTQLDLRHLIHLKDEFLTIASHDLKGMLMKVHGYASLAQGAVPPGATMTRETHEMLKKLNLCAWRMQRVVVDFLDFQALSEHRLEIEPGLIDIDLIAREIVDLHAPCAEEKNLDLHFEPGCGHVSLSADAKRVRQVIENLVDNAIKFSLPDGRIEVRTARREKDVFCEVRDEGPGLTDNDLKWAFSRYTKLSSRPTGHETSHGIGLAICKHLVGLHGGEIGVRNNEGAGATFWFSLPLK
ncbi:response regulator [Candidatus Sumerlaeota bacterium]|nr:response regulator [Candidatus Sumerlaeota bacterium]